MRPIPLLLLLSALSLPALSQAAARVEVLQNRLAHPWSLAFLPGDQGMLITLRGGELKRWQPGKGLSAPIAGVPQVWANGRGLTGRGVGPGFRAVAAGVAKLCGKRRQRQSGHRGGLRAVEQDATQLTNFTVVFRQQPKLSVGNHFGGRLVFDGKGHLFIGLGENNQRPTAQDLDKLQGKVVRLTENGGVPPDNPFVGRADVRPEIWAYGIRNPQGMAINPWSGALWLNEHGPRGGDEINIPQAGKNYGWPLATHGINYSGLPIPEARGKTVPGTEPPLYVWPVSPGVSGMAFYAAQTFPQWQHKLFIGALKETSLIVLAVDGNQVREEGRLLEARGKRIRDVRVGPDGYLYVLTDESNGELLRLSPEK
ncbi:PQQ-dependent sugar dehydrogenase [Klebsiella quasipneumoniae]